MLEKVGLGLDWLMTIHTQDAEQRRRGRLLGILVMVVVLAVLIITVVNLAQFLSTPSTEGMIFVGADLLGLLLLGFIFYLNRISRTRWASLLLLGSLILLISFAFPPRTLDRVLILYVLPTMAASFVTRPAASFVFATLSWFSYALAWLLNPSGLSLNFVSGIGFYLMAFVAWIAAINLENALRESRKRAEELDHRVMERTSDLAEALQREHAEASKNEAVLQSIGDGVIVFDQDRRAIVVNPAACSILGCREEELLERDVNQIMGEVVSEEDQAIIRSLIESEATSRMGIKVNWGRKIVAVSVAPVRLPMVERAGAVMVFRDITKEAEVDRMKSEFVSIVSHELRTPMTAIKGYLELLLAGTASPDPRTQYSFLEIVKSNADRLGDMVDELLDVSRIEAGKIQMRFQPVSVYPVIHDVAAMLQKTYANPNVELRLNVSPGLPKVLADPGRLTQIVTNLMSNALKYTLQGHVEVTAHVQDDRVQVDISDTGIGMTEEDQARLFTRFFRASTARASDIPGTGLGLSITRSLIEMHSGQIWVKSAVGRGSTFSFTLPILPASLAQMALTGPAPAVVASNGSLFKIFVVDSELEIAHLLRQQLEAEGYTVLITTRGKDALPLARREKPNLILLDILLQDVNSVQVLHQLSHDPDTRSIPVVVTAIGPEDQKGFALGAADYLTKPIDPDRLLATVRRVLAAHTPGQVTNSPLAASSPD